MKAIFELVTTPSSYNPVAADEIKKNITSQLQETVRQLCATSNYTEAQEATEHLCAVIEAIFLNGLKTRFISRVYRNLSEMNSQNNLNFWNLLMEISHQENIKYVENLRIIKTEVGQCRAWIRVALNESLLSSYLKTIRQNQKTILRYYNSYAFLLDAEALEIAQILIECVENVSLSVPCNSGILNTWSNYPLCLAGVSTQPIRQAVVTGVDVAEMIISTDLVCSEAAELPEQVQSRMGQTMSLDSDDSLKLVLKTHSIIESRSTESAIGETSMHGQPNCLENTNFPKKDSGQNLTEEIGYEKKNTERNKVLERSYSSLIESNIFLNCDESKIPEFQNMIENLLNDASDELSHTNLDISSNKTVEKIENDKTMVISDNHKLIYGKQKSKDGTGISRIYGVADKNDKQRFENNNVMAKPDSDELLSTLISVISRERGLDNQDFKCKACNQQLLTLNKPQVCAYSGFYFCGNCMAEKAITIPARIVHNWDFKKYVVSKQSYDYLERVKEKPIINFKLANPYIYTAIDEMAALQVLRNRLNYIRAYIFTCREPIIDELQRKVRPRGYLYEHIHQYSISDLLETHNGILASKLQHIIDFGKNHIGKCWLCCQKGFVCELCDDVKPLFPYDTHKVYRCSKCMEVFHNTCLNESKPCPRCVRKRERSLSKENN